MLKIAPGQSLIEGLVNRYQIWCDAKSFYGDKHDPCVTIAQGGIPCYHQTQVNDVNKHHDELIAIDCLTEGIHSMSYFKKYNKSNRYLIFVNGPWDTSFYDLGIEYQLIPHNFFLFEMADTYNSPNRFCYHLDKKYNIAGSKPYVFVSTIGNQKPHRDYLVEKLMSSLTYDNFLLRYSGQDINGNGAADVIQFTPGDFDPYMPMLEKYYHNVSQTLPINMLNQGYFNLAVETDIHWTNEFFLTEKTIKNLIIGMPFVSMSTPHFLKNLRSMGFETYSSLWDESYDDVEDFHKRVDCVIELCNNLKNFDWNAAKDELTRIGSANKLNFMNLSDLANQEFLNLEKVIGSL